VVRAWRIAAGESVRAGSGDLCLSGLSHQFSACLIAAGRPFVDLSSGSKKMTPESGGVPLHFCRIKGLPQYVPPRDVLAEALELPADERARIAAELLDSLDYAREDVGGRDSASGRTGQSR